MKITALKCPNCHAPYEPANKNCAYCGSYIIFTGEDELDYNPDVFDPPATSGEDPAKTYVEGILLYPGERPVRVGTAAQQKNAFYNRAGRLLLTNHRLVFIPSENEAIEWQLSGLKKAKARTPMLPLSYIGITLKDGKKVSFNVYGPRKWADSINAAT